MGSRLDQQTGTPQTVDEARTAVEESRQRISGTLSALETRIVDKKHELQARADVLRPVREQIVARPFTALAVGIGVGALLGSLGGSDDEPTTRRGSGRLSGAELSDADRRELREWRRARKRRLRAVRRSRDDLRGDHDDHDNDDGDSRFDALKHQLLGALTSAITTAVASRVRRLALDNMGSVVDNVLGGDDGHRDSRTDGGPPQARDHRATERQSYR